MHLNVCCDLPRLRHCALFLLAAVTPLSHEHLVLRLSEHWAIFCLPCCTGCFWLMRYVSSVVWLFIKCLRYDFPLYSFINFILLSRLCVCWSRGSREEGKQVEAFERDGKFVQNVRKQENGISLCSDMQNWCKNTLLSLQFRDMGQIGKAWVKDFIVLS